jgi:Zn-dependent protease with chaperone function
MGARDYELEAYSQANEDLRHFSTLRFSVLGAFVAISGGLFVFAVEKLKGTGDFSAIALFAVAIAVAFMVFELRINAIAEFYASKVDGLAEELGMSAKACSAPRKSFLGAWLAPFVMLVSYGGSVAMWLYAWLG